MATSLALQLKRLAVPQAQSALGREERDKKSLLFDTKEASKLDKETFYAIGKDSAPPSKNAVSAIITQSRYFHLKSNFTLIHSHAKRLYIH